MYYTYLRRCRDGSLYAGITTDLLGIALIALVVITNRITGKKPAEAA